MRQQIYKFTTQTQTSPFGSGRWVVGKYRNVYGEIIPCVNGFHGVGIDNLIAYANPRLWKAEIDGEFVWYGNGPMRKIVARSMRITEEIATWNRHSLLLFAADCVKRIAPDTEIPGLLCRLEVMLRYSAEHGYMDTREANLLWHDLNEFRMMNPEATVDRSLMSNAASFLIGDISWWTTAWSFAHDAVRIASRFDRARSCEEHQWQGERLAEILGLPWDYEERTR